MPPADQFRRVDQLAAPFISMPLQVLLCGGCGLSQLSYVVRPEILYQDEYPYEASTTRAGRRHFRAFAATTVRRLGLRPNDLAVDVGSNVGVLLGGFRDEGLRVCGIDPAPNIAQIARRRGIPTVTAFFGVEAARGVRSEYGAAHVITATNVFAHVDDLDQFMTAVDGLLAPDGALVIEAPYFGNLVADLEYDTVYHEHLSYISVRPLLSFFSRHGMRVFDVQEVDIHGGSFRVFVDRGRRPVRHDVIERFLAREQRDGTHDMGRLLRLAADVRANRDALTSLMHGLRAQGKRIAAVSAPAKGMTLLNYCRLGNETIEFVTEKSALKIGRYTPGAHIPVVGDEELLARRPDVALLLAWNFADEIMSNLAEYTAGGGSFILPIPQPRIAGGPPALIGGHEKPVAA
jgi:SAM-dependent methyltransferase